MYFYTFLSIISISSSFCLIIICYFSHVTFFADKNLIEKKINILSLYKICFHCSNTNRNSFQL